MNDIKPETFDVSRRPDFRRPFSDGSMAVATSDLAASLESSFLPFQYAAPPFQAQPFPFNSHSLPNAMHNDNDILPATKMQRGRAGRKMSMNDVKPHIRSKSGSSGPPGSNSAGTGPRAMSFSHTDRPFLGLQTHFENQQTNSVSPPDFPFGINLPTRWDGGVGMSLPAMSFGTTIDEAIMDSPPDAHAHLALDEELHKKQRRRECHNQVEKRRREHINAKIEELSHLLPSHYQQTDDMDEEEDEGDSPKKRKPRRNSMAKKDAGPCKGRVLSHSVQYIQDLRHANDLQANRIAQLEAMLSGTSFSPQQAQSHSQTRAQLFYSPNLQQMPPSPDANTYDQPPAWNQYSAFSPDLRSSSTSSDNRSAPGPGAGTGPLPRMRTGSEMDIQVGLGGMDLENVFQRREDGW